MAEDRLAFLREAVQRAEERLNRSRATLAKLKAAEERTELLLHKKRET